MEIGHRCCSDLTLLPFRVISTTPRLRKCLRRAGTWHPQCLCATSAPAQARISLALSGVAKEYVPHFTAYKLCWNAKCCLISLFNFDVNLESSTSFYLLGLGGRFWKRKSHLFTEFILTSSYAFLHCCNHCTKVVTQYLGLPVKCLRKNLENQLIHHKVFWYDATLQSICGCSCTNKSSERNSTVPVRRCGYG